jgi:hypothetical protein
VRAPPTVPAVGSRPVERAPRPGALPRARRLACRARLGRTGGGRSRGAHLAPARAGPVLALHPFLRVPRRGRRRPRAEGGAPRISVVTPRTCPAGRETRQPAEGEVRTARPQHRATSGATARYRRGGSTAPARKERRGRRIVTTRRPEPPPRGRRADHPARQRREAGTPSASRARQRAQGVARPRAGGANAGSPGDRPRHRSRAGRRSEAGRAPPSRCRSAAHRATGGERRPFVSVVRPDLPTSMRCGNAEQAQRAPQPPRRRAGRGAGPVERGRAGAGAGARASDTRRARDDRPARAGERTITSRHPRTSGCDGRRAVPGRRQGGPRDRSWRKDVSAVFRAVPEPSPDELRARAGSGRSASPTARRSGNGADGRRACSPRPRRQRVPAPADERGRRPIGPASPRNWPAHGRPRVSPGPPQPIREGPCGSFRRGGGRDAAGPGQFPGGDYSEESSAGFSRSTITCRPR